MLPKFSKKAQNVKAGLYKHYKGGLYSVIEVAFHHETLEEWVAYRAEYGERQCFIRPLEMFLEDVEVNGELVPRFRYLGQ
jgi:hypothetical protein